MSVATVERVIPRDANGKGNDIPKLAAPVQAFKDRYLA